MENFKKKTFKKLFFVKLPLQNSKLINPFIKFKFKKYAFYKFCQNENTSFELGDLGRLDSDLDSCLGSNFIRSALNLSRSCNNRFILRSSFNLL